MTLIAGLFSRDDSPLQESVCTALRSSMSRNPADAVETFRDKRLCLMKIDIGAYGEPGVFRDPLRDAVSYVTGEPLLKTGDDTEFRRRDEDLATIHNDLCGGSLQGLKSATGIFSVAHYDARTATLTLATDKIGHRAIYYWIDDHQVIFASTLRILEAIPNLPKTMDALAVLEVNIYPRHTLGDRTPYREIKRLRSGEFLEFKHSRIRSGIYWDFGAVQQTSENDEQVLLRDSHRRFMSAVRRRLRNDKVVAACLSGGLDSRAVVSALRALDTHVHTVNMYALSASQDRVFASEFSRAAGTVHSEVEVPAWVSGQTFERTVMDAADESFSRAGEETERPQLLWTGDGGSVSSGHLHIEQPLADLLRQGRMKEAFLSYHLGTVTPRIFNPAFASRMEDVMFRAFLQEMYTLPHPDRARAFHIFLIKNHQRKDFVQHFEYIDLHRIEFQCPLYDSDYLESIVRLPFDLTVGHRFYHKWMALFPPFATAVPWQTYEHHEPCPLPVPPGAVSQWNANTLSVAERAKRRSLTQRAVKALRSPTFPAIMLKKNVLRAARWMHALGLRNCESTIAAAASFSDYWNKCGGAYYIPGESEVMQWPMYPTTKTPNETAKAR